MSTAAKDIRKQVRNVVQEILPELLQSEVFKELYDQLEKKMIKQLEDIKVEIRQTLALIDQRSKDVQSFIMNQVQAELAKGQRPVESEPVQSEIE